MALQFANVSEIFRNSIKLENLNSNHDPEVSSSFTCIVLSEEKEEPQASVTKDAGYWKGRNDQTNQTLVQLQEQVSSYGCHLKSSSATGSHSSGSTIKVECEPVASVDHITALSEGDLMPVDKKPLFSSQQFKDDLRRKILARRTAEGKQMIDLAQEEEMRRKEQELNNQLTQEDIERRQRKRRQNNMAAKRCRENKKRQEIKMDKEMEAQIHRRKQLLQALVELQHEKETLQNIWKDCNQGITNPTIRSFISELSNKDFDKYIPKPIPFVDLSFDSDNSNSVSDMESLSSSQGSVETFVSEPLPQNHSDIGKVDEISQTTLFSEIFTDSSKRIETYLEESINSCSLLDDNLANRHGNSSVKREIKDQEVTDIQLRGSARNTLFELAEATYSEMKASEEKRKMRSLLENQPNEVEKVHSCDSDEDFEPLVIDLTG